MFKAKVLDRETIERRSFIKGLLWQGEYGNGEMAVYEPEDKHVGDRRVFWFALVVGLLVWWLV